MSTGKIAKQLCIDDLRHAEYYQMQTVFDDLYERSRKGEKFLLLMETILMRENILLAYRNIKANAGSNTAGTDGLNIKDIGRLQPDEVVERVRYIVQGSKHGYRPRPVRRKDIPKPNGSTRPLGIPCIWDRLIQQCIKQVMEPICEAKFSENSFGFRPNRSVEYAIQRATYRMQRSKLHYIIEFDIKAFFDEVNHAKLKRQIWAMGIRDKHLIYVLGQILKASIKLPDGKMVYPEKGTPQGGIISPLLANIVLNELDHWVESQWQDNPVARKYYVGINRKNGSEHLGEGYEAMRKTRLKEMYIVRYADDFRIFCRTKTDAENTKTAVIKWLRERLKLEVSDEKTRIVNAKRRFAEFLGFKMKLHLKAGKYVVMSHMSDKAFSRAVEKICTQAKNVAKPRAAYTEEREVKLYNAMVTGIQNYYCIATNVSKDCDRIYRRAMVIFTNRLSMQGGTRLRRKGRELTRTERKRYGESKCLRFIAGSWEPIYPIGYIRHKKPMAKKRSVCSYTADGRREIHDDLRIQNKYLMWEMMRKPAYGKSAELADNRISLFSAQYGKCAVTGNPFQTTEEIHCHHKKPRHKGGKDEYGNLILVLEPVHRLIHSTKQKIVEYYLDLLKLNARQITKVNGLRKQAGLKPIHKS